MPALRTTARWAACIALSLVASTPALAAGQIAVVGNTVEEHAARPGESYNGSIVIRNFTSKPQPVRIYQTDYTFFADGTSHFDTAGSVARSNASWITPSATAVTAPPNGDVTVAYTVQVPRASGVDSLRGTYWSTIMVEGATDTPPPATDKAQIGLGVVVRYAVQIATHIDNTGSRKITFTNQHVALEKDNTQSLQLTFEDVGERAYRPLIWVEVYDDQGALRVTQKQQRGLLYPGTSAVQKFALGKLPSGSYKAIVFADVGNDEVVAMQYKLQF